MSSYNENMISDFQNWNDRARGDIVDAVLRGSFNVVSRFLEKEPGLINYQRKDSGITPLMAASGSCMDQMVSFLLSVDGIDLDLKDGADRDVFTHAKPFPSIVQKLVDHKYPKLQWQEPAP